MYKVVVYNNEVDLNARRGILVKEGLSFTSSAIRQARKEAMKVSGAYGVVRADSGRCYYIYEESSDTESHFIPRNNLFVSTYSSLAEISKLLRVESGSIVISNITEGHACFRVVKEDNINSELDVSNNVKVFELLHLALTGIPQNIESVIIPAKLYYSSNNMECFYSGKRGSDSNYLAFIQGFEVPWLYE